MVNETSGENLLEFSKMLDETFGPTEYNTEEILPSKVDPSREKSTQALTLGPSPTMSETEIEPRPEQKKVKINVSLPQEHSVKEHNRETSSDSITTKDSHIFDVTKDISINSKEDTTEAPLRNPGFIEMRLKRKSIMGLEEDDSDCLTNSQPVTEELHIETDNPSHLFWVPAHLHPEIAPNEFRKWLKNHAKDGFNSGIGSLRRRKSTLSKQYIPSDVEDDEEETTDKKVEPEKKWTGFDWESYIGSDGNINPTSESTKLNILRRSLSLNLPPFMGGSISNPNDPNIFDRHSSPDVDSKVLVPRMSPALKRAARTKIRRNSVAGEQNPRRFSAHRRTRSTHVSSDKEKQSENNIVSKRPKQKSESLSVPQITIDKVDKKLNSSEIVDEPEEIQKDIELECIDVKDGAGPIRITLKDEVAPPEVSSQITPALHKTSSLASDENELSSELQVDQSDESNSLKVNTSKPGTFSTTISPSTSPNSTSPTSLTTPTSSTQKRKSTDDSLTTTNTTTSLSQPIISNKKTKYTNYNRLPIHVERAIYRLSHVKLANPRRPLHEQVLISNMMFWYLSLINKQQVEHGGGGNPNAEIAAHKVKSKVGKEKTSRKRKKAEKKSGLTRKGAGPGSSAEIAYKAPQYDMNQISQQYMTPPTSTNEFEEETVEDFGDNIDYHGEDEIQAHGYHHYNDEYLSDGTDGGYLDETNGRIESSHSGGLLHSSAEFDDNIGESSSGIKNNNYVRSPSPNGRSKSSTGRSKSPTGRPTSPNKKSGPPTPQRNSVPPS
ncbi:12838_t:CDS:2, partial [Rhizophagus irregularis]